MALVKERLKRVEQIKSGERTLLQEAHEMVVNENFPDLPEALEFITDQEAEESIMHHLIETQEFEECAKIMRQKHEILLSMEKEE